MTFLGRGEIRDEDLVPVMKYQTALLASQEGLSRFPNKFWLLADP